MRLPGLGASMGCNNLGKRVSGADAGLDNAGGPGHRTFFRRPGCADDKGADTFCPLAENLANTAGGGINQINMLLDFFIHSSLPGRTQISLNHVFRFFFDNDFHVGGRFFCVGLINGGRRGFLAKLSQTLREGIANRE